MNRSSVICVASCGYHRARTTVVLASEQEVKEDKETLSIVSDVQETLTEDAMLRVVAKKQNGRNHSLGPSVTR